MASSRGRNGAPPSGHGRSGSNMTSDEDSVIPTRQIEAFGRKVTATAGHLMGPLGDGSVSQHYQNALGELHRELRRPGIQRSIFSYAQAPKELVRSKLSVPEIQHRALTYLPEELLHNIPESNNAFSLFQGFQASIPEDEEGQKRKHDRHSPKGTKLLGDAEGNTGGLPALEKLKSDKSSLDHRLEMMGIRKNMCASEIREIDNRITNLNTMRKIVLERLAGLEQEEAELEHNISDVDNKLEILQEELEDAAAMATKSPSFTAKNDAENDLTTSQVENNSFMSESIYQKLPSPKSRRLKITRRKSMPILHEHLEPGSQIRELQAHNDMVSAVDFDVPFGTMVTAALDDTVRVWNLNAGRCMGLLEGHLSSVRCLQVEDNIVATGSMDASIRLWDLNRAEYVPRDNRINKETDGEDEGDNLEFEDPDNAPSPSQATSMQDCPLFSLEAHVAEVTALHFRGDTLVSGSADKTLRQWDLEKGRCVQTLDVLWAAAQASASLNTNDSQWRQTGRPPDASADFVGALQCFDAALACGTADGMVRLWDLRSGQVHRSLVGHTGPVTSLQFDDVHLVTGSLDRSIRIWDLRTGSIYDAYAYDNPITSMMFDTRRIVAAAGEDVVKVYDKTDGRHWDCGPGAISEGNEAKSSTVERVRIKDGYMVEGRKDGMVRREDPSRPVASRIGTRSLATATEQHVPFANSLDRFGPRLGYAPKDVRATSAPEHLAESSVPGLHGWNPSDPIMISGQSLALSTNKIYVINGSGGDLSELMSNLHTSVRVGRFDRARAIMHRLQEYYTPDSREMRLAHSEYLKVMFTSLISNTTSFDAVLRDMQRWFELEVRGKDVQVDASCLVFMIRASIAGTRASKRDRALRRYLDVAMSMGPLVHRETLTSDNYTESELAILNSACPNESEAPFPSVTNSNVVEPSIHNTDIESSPDKALAHSGYIPEILAVEQKGLGLDALKKSLSIFTDKATLPYPHDMQGTKEEKDKAYAYMREARIEQDAVDAAMERWRADTEQMAKVGIHPTLRSPPVGALIWDWHQRMLPLFKQELTEVRRVLGTEGHASGEDRQLYGPFMESLTVEKLAAITILTLLDQLSRKNHSNLSSGPGVKIGHLTMSIGRALQHESDLEEYKKQVSSKSRLKLLSPNQQLQVARAAKRASRRYDRSGNIDFDWPADVKIKLGALLVSKLIEAARIPPENDNGILEAQPAFYHTFGYQSGRKYGFITPSPLLTAKLKKEPVYAALAKRLPMLVEPRPWTGFEKGGFIEHPVPVLRQASDKLQVEYARAAADRGDMDQIYAGLDVLGKTAWRINRDVFDVQVEAWNSGKPIANFAPLNPEISFPPEPEAGTDKFKKKAWVRRCKELNDEKSGFHSKRCFQNFQLEVARAYLNEDMYFPHNLDFRGRAYPIPPYLNHMGADNCRGLLRFSKGKELGTAGLFWLKVHLANVYGYDKASLQEREAFAMEHLADVYDSATNPLNGKRWWLGAEDEWQCLAACFELKHALDSPDPTRYVSHLPIHQDGTCNGLQHYAALGGDKAGAQQVNLEPRDRPSDIYSAVASLVEAEVDTEAAEGNMKAVTVKGKITRKVVKQTVMTNVYGVTFIGARAQVQKQLEILLPDLPRDKPDLTHNALAGYIAAKIFKSLGALFTGARAIQKWFGECANRIATTITSEQIEQLGRESRGEVIYLAPKLKDKALQKGKKRIQPTLMFRSSIIWTTPLKMPVVQPYRSVKSREIATNIQNISFVDPHATDPISRRKQLQGFPPNFIHSLDATHMLLSALKCDEKGLSFASVHDSFWTHAADIPKMNLVLRDAFVAMHGEDIIGRLASEFAARYKGSIYLASVYKRSKVGEQIHAWRSVKYASKRHANSAKHQIPELFEEAERQRLLSSEDPELRKQGEEMVTPASIFLAANDPSAFAVPSEIAMSELGRIDESASPEEAREDADLFASAFSDPSSAALAEAAEHNTVVDVEGEQYETSSDSDEAMDSVGAVTSGERDTSDKEKAMLDRVTEVTRELRADGAYVVPPRKRRPQHYKLSLWLPLTFPPVPEKGDFDVTRLKESQYFFS